MNSGSRKTWWAGWGAALGAALLPFGSVSISQVTPNARVGLSHGNIRYVEPAAATGLESGETALRTYATVFGIADADSQLQEVRRVSLGAAGQLVRMRQLHQGVPVIAGDLLMSLDGAGRMRSLRGRVNPRLALTTTVPRVSSADASRVAVMLAAKQHQMSMASLTAGTPELSVYDSSLLGPADGRPPVLVWRVEVTPIVAVVPVREFVLIDANTGAWVMNFNQAETLRNRLTYTANNTATYPGTLLCNESQPLCTSGVNPDADLAHRYAGQTYDFYMTRFGRDSFNNLGATITSTVQWYGGAGSCPNAFWYGTQMVYCAGAPQADDVVGHELTHAVTQYASGLYYYYQSGAINESLSDVFGEFLDLTNGEGTDTVSVRWLMGEDFPGLGAIRDMMNPGNFGQPDRMANFLTYSPTFDNGGVHINSGINNHAAALMVDGGDFNGYHMTGIGIDKVAAIYYRVQTQYLTSGSDYADLGLALNQACSSMVGVNGITGSDCIQVANAVNAVEMFKEPTVDAGNEAPVCSTNQVAQPVYYDSFETAPDPTRWATMSLLGSAAWGVFPGYATQGKRSYAIAGPSTASDTALTMVSGVALPAGAFLHFRHAVDQEFVASTTTAPAVYHDGGVVEYSVDGGVSWADLAGLYSAGLKYGGAISTATGSPIAGRNAFVAASHGYSSTRYNLSSLTGASFKLRFRNTSDSSIGSGRAWAIDEVQIYTCVADSAPNIAPVANAGADVTTGNSKTVTLNGSASNDPDGYIVSSVWSQIGGPAVLFSTTSGVSISFLPLSAKVQDTLVFRLTVTDNRGAVSTDDVTVNVVNPQPVVNAGPDQSKKPRDVVTLSGTATDADGIISPLWTQISGPAVIFLNTNGGTTTSFTAPSVSTTSKITLRLTATDLYGGMGSDDVDITVTNAAPTADAGADVSISSSGAVTLTGSGTDSDGTVTSYRWSLVSGSGGTIISPTARVTSFVAPAVTVQTSLTLRLTVTDNDGGTATDDVVINIQPPVVTTNSGSSGGGGGGGALRLPDLWLVLLFALARRCVGRRSYLRH